MKYDSTTNIIILGESNSGKTTLIYNYLYNSLNTKDNITTIGIDYYKKVLYNNENSYLLNIYDTGNGLLYRNILDVYLRKSEIFIIILKEDSFRFVKEVFNIINSDKKIDPKHIFIILNKNIDNYDFTYHKIEISKHNIKNSYLHFSYFDIFSKSNVDLFFNNLSKYIFYNNDNNDNIIKNSKKLIPLNIKDNTIPNKKYKKHNLSCCDHCCIIS